MAEFMKEAANFERDLRKECSVLMRKDADEWEAKNRAVSQLTRMVAKYQDCEVEKIQEVFGMSAFRVLKEPIKQMMSDLRSQQVRDTCTFLSTMSVVLGDHMRHFLRDIFPCVLDGVKQTNKVMGGYVDECIVTMIRNTTFKTSIPIIIEQIQSSKSKQYRERCIDYINEIIVSWDITDKDAEMLSEAIKTGLEDASVRCREISRLAYLNMFQMFPHKTETLKSELSKAVQKRLNQEEDKFLASEEYQLGQREIEECELQARSDKLEGDLSSQFNKSAHISPAFNGEKGKGEDADLLTDMSAPPTLSRANTSTASDGRSPVSLRTRRQSVEEGSVTTIQAVVRGALSRRMSALRANDIEEGNEEEAEESNSASAAGGVAPVPNPAPALVKPGDQPTPSPALKSTRGAHTLDKGEFPPATTSALLESPKGTPPSSQKKVNPKPNHHQSSIYSSTGKFTVGVTPSKTIERTTKKKKMASHTPHTQSRVTAPMGPLDEACRQEALGLLKLKVNFMMRLVEKNMDVLRTLEGGENEENVNEDENGAALNEETVNQMIHLSGEEVKLCRNFEDRLNMMIVKQQHSTKIGPEIERSPLEEQFASV